MLNRYVSRSLRVQYRLIDTSVRGFSTAPPPDPKALAEAKKKEEEAKALQRAKDVDEGKLNYEAIMSKKEYEGACWALSRLNVNPTMPQYTE